MKMTRTLTVAAAAVAAIALSACEAPEPTKAGAPRSTTTVTQHATQAPKSTTVERAAAPTSKATSLDEIAERAFLNTVADYQSPSDEASLMVGRATCKLLDEGSTPDTLAYELMLADGPVVPGFLNDELPHFYGAAMGSLCAEYGERFFG